MPIAPSQVVDALKGVPGIVAAAAKVQTAALDAVRTKNPSFVVEDSGLDPASASTAFGNAAEVLARGPAGSSEAALVSALLALSCAEPLPADADQRALVHALIWLSSHSDTDPLAYLDAALGARAEPLWKEIATLAQGGTQGLVLDRSERLVANAALEASASHAARNAAPPPTAIGASTRPPAAAPFEAPLKGELAPAPFGPVGTVLFALSGLSLVRGLARLTGRVALAYKVPAELGLNERGLEIAHHTELLGRVLRDRAVIVPFENVASVAREVRYARLGLYAGLVALVLGTYVGAGLLVDGVRVPGGSPSLLGMGLAAIGLGVVLDFVLAVVVDVVRSTCRIVVTPRKGPRLCINGLDLEATNRLLARLAEAGSADASG